jgi:molybdopterin-guanine dinucleotide biosynthesis protein A
MAGDAAMSDASVIVLTGGSGRRLGGADKARLDVTGEGLLDHVLRSLPPGMPVVVCGDVIGTCRPVEFVREDPPGGGPAAGVATAIALVRTPLVGLLAVDMPWGAAPMQQALVALHEQVDVDAVLTVSEDGRDQPLCSAWRTAALRAAVVDAGPLTDRPMRDLVARVRTTTLAVAMEDLLDIDTPEDLERARRRSTSA